MAVGTKAKRRPEAPPSQMGLVISMARTRAHVVVEAQAHSVEVVLYFQAVNNQAIRNTRY